MRVDVGDVRLFVDVEGAGLVADGPVMRQKPTLILLHGGPGADHSIFKPHYGARLADIAQIIYVDHRGNGRSDEGRPADWHLAQWADDIATLCNRLGIEKPIVFGASFGGFVAQSFATRHPDRLGGLIVSNTAAKVNFEVIYDAFTRIGGDVAGQAARAYWGNPTSETRRAYADACLQCYSRVKPDADFWARVIMKDPVALHFNGPDNEMGRFDFRAGLADVRCPALVISGDTDPIMPKVFAEDISKHLTGTDPEYHCLANAGHLPECDAPDSYFTLLRNFITRIAQDA